MTENVAAPALNLYAFKAPKEPHGTIGMPCRDHVSAATMMSMATSALAPTWFEQGTVIDVNICQGNVLTMQRNDLVYRMRGDWLLFIDDDMVWHPEQIVQLIQSREKYDLDMVGALCFRRSPPHQPTLFMRRFPNDGPFNYLEDWPEDTAVEVDATGMAFIIIHKRVFERMVAFYEKQPDWKMPPYEERDFTKAPPNFFQWNGGFGEDLQFCINAKQSGSKIYVDTSIEVRHVSEIQIGREHFLTEIAKRDPELEAGRRTINDEMGFNTLTREEARRRLGW